MQTPDEAQEPSQADDELKNLLEQWKEAGLTDTQLANIKQVITDYEPRLTDDELKKVLDPAFISELKKLKTETKDNLFNVEALKKFIDLAKKNY